MTVTTPNSGPTADSNDEGVTRKLLDHIDAQVHVIGQQTAELIQLRDEFAPLLAMLRRPDGKPDMLGVMQARRMMGRRRG